MQHIRGEHALRCLKHGWSSGEEDGMLEEGVEEECEEECPGEEQAAQEGEETLGGRILLEAHSWCVEARD